MTETAMHCAICGKPLPVQHRVGRKLKYCPAPSPCRAQPRPYTKPYEELKALAATGLSQAAIARQLHVGRERVRQLLHKAGIFDLWKATQPKKKERIIKLCYVCGEQILSKQHKYCGPEHARLGIRETRFWRYAKNPAHYLELARRWRERSGYKRDPEKRRATQKRYLQRHRAERSERFMQRYHNDPEFRQRVLRLQASYRRKRSTA